MEGFSKIKRTKYAFSFKIIYFENISSAVLLRAFMIWEKMINLKQLQIFLQLLVRSSVVIRHRLAWKWLLHIPMDDDLREK